MHDENTQGSRHNSEIIIANPGTGKTTTIAGRVATLLKEGIKPSDILCLTFTVKASEEMLSAIRKKCDDIGVDPRIANEVEVSTFHSFAYGQLSEFGDLLRITNSTILLRFSILRSIHRHNPFTHSRSHVVKRIVPKLENAIRYVKSFGILPDMIEEQQVLEMGSKHPQYRDLELSDDAFARFVEFFLETYKGYERFKEGNFLDFNDILLKYLDIPASRRRKYQYVFVDELQDVNIIQARIIDEAGEVKILVGDRKQSIFGFQGGTLSVFEKFASDHRYEEIILDENYRSTKQIIDYAKEYLRHASKSDIYEKELKEFRASSKNGQGDLPEVVFSNEPTRTAANLASTLLESTGEKDRIAVITRTNEQLQNVSRYLDNLGVQYTNYSPPSSSEEARNDIKTFLKGLLSYDERDVIKALFTPFSGIGIAEAMKISSRYRSYERNPGSNNVQQVKSSDVEMVPRLETILGTDLFKKMKYLFEARQKLDEPHGLTDIFSTRILPASVPMGRDYFLTVNVIFNSLQDIIRTGDPMDLDELIDFVDVVDVNYDPLPGAGRIVLTTVHRAKGREFEHVVYVPQSNNKREKLMDFVTNIIIQSTLGKDASSELEGEGSRVDFVAFTRAKRSLSIVIKENYRKNYVFPDICRLKGVDVDSALPSISNAFSEAYSLFVAGRVNEALEALNDNGNWLIEEIRRHFFNLNHISHSSINSIMYPLDYLIERIINVRKDSAALDFGTIVHHLAVKLYYDTPLGELDDTSKAIVRNIQSIRNMIIGEGAQQIYAEKWITLPVGDIFPYLDSENSLMITGAIDAVFRLGESGKYLILDYKSSRNIRNGDYSAQLLLYRKMFAKQQRIPEGDISLAVGYVALREDINTGEYNYELKYLYPNSRTEARIVDQVRNFIRFKKDPDAFLDYFMEANKRSSGYFKNTSISRSIEALLGKIYLRRSGRSGGDSNYP